MGPFVRDTEPGSVEPRRGWIRSRDAMKRLALGFAGLLLVLVAMNLLGGTPSVVVPSTEQRATAGAAQVEPPNAFEADTPLPIREIVVPEAPPAEDAGPVVSYFAFLDGGYYRDPEICDPVEPGECTLELTASYASGGGSASCEVALFRIGAPANERWGEGDQCVFERLEVVSLRAYDEVSAEAEEPEGRSRRRGSRIHTKATRITNLPAGRYRIVVLQAALGLPDPPPFEVKGPLTHHSFQISLPQQEVAYIELFDESGARVQSAQMEIGAYRVKARETRQPSWRRARKWMGPHPLKALPRYLTTRSEGSRSYERNHLAGSAGFVTPPLLLDRVGASVETPIRFTDSRGATCTVVVKGAHGAGSRRYVGVLVSTRAIANAVVTADGQVPESLVRAIVVEAQGVHLQYGSADQAWLDVPIELSIVHREHHEVGASFTMRRGIPAITLVRRS